MLIKEYHIPLPLTLEEYKIAQLYMIQKKSREESEGTESGVEIIENRPYTDGPFGQGQYTYKVYHIGRHIPGWLRGMVPKTALEVHEESWNAYPRTKTKFSVPFVEKFTLEIDTVFQQDSGKQENIFNLTRAEQRNREVDTIDIVNDALVGSDYKEEEDPSLYVSNKTGRGPLPDDWITNPPSGVIMCSYKLIKVEFRYWGLQSRIERFIHDYGLRRVMLRAHRQAWAWQDEWVGLTIDDIRRLERETKLILQRKLGRAEIEDEELEEEENETEPSPVTSNPQLHDSTAAAAPVTTAAKRYSLAVSTTTSLPPNYTLDPEEASFCALDNIAIHEDSDSEYFDAREDVSEDDQETDSDEFVDPTPQPHPHPSLEDLNDSFYDQTDEELDEENPTHRSAKSPHPRSILLIVTIASSVFNSDVVGGDPELDLQMMRETFEEVYSKHYQNSLSQIIIKFVLCPKITSNVCDLLQSIQPPSSPQGNHNFPLTALPLLLLEDPSYHASVRDLTEKLNSIYCRFKQSEEGVNFSGDVCVVSDCISSLMVYDVLTRPSTPLLPGHAHLSSSSNHLDWGEEGRGGGGGGGQSPGTIRSASVPSGSKSVPLVRKGDGTLELPGLNRSSSSLFSSLVFNVSKFFTFGSPLGLVLLLKRLRGVSLTRPKCSSLYNLFYAVDPLGFRLEPLIDESFSTIDPLLIPCYLVYPTGDKSSVALSEFVSYVGSDEGKGRSSGRDTSNEFLFVLDEEVEHSRNDHRAWWGTDRIDYLLQAPASLEGVVSLPNTSYGHIVQSRYLEAKEMASFVLRQVLLSKSGTPSASATRSGSGLWVPFVPQTSIVKWAKRKTPLRIQKMSPNHRAVDIVIASHSTQLPSLQAKFFYGPLNITTLSGEMVNIYILMPHREEDPSMSLEEGEETKEKRERAWYHLDTTSTDKHGRISYPLSPEQVPSSPGVYPLIYLVKGDHTLAISNMFVVPSYTEAVVFSIDGALCSSFSLSGRDMRLKTGALEVTRLWQQQGYLLIYITGRPIFQKEYIISWLTLHGFPLGIVSFSDTLSTDAQNMKLLYLARLMKEARMILCGAYGSVRHLSVYKELGLQPDQIYLHGNSKKSSGSTGKGKSEYQLLTNGFSDHLKSFKPRPAVVNMNSVIGEYNFDYSKIKRSHSQRLRHSSTSSLGGGAPVVTASD